MTNKTQEGTRSEKTNVIKLELPFLLNREALVFVDQATCSGDNCQVN